MEGQRVEIPTPAEKLKFNHHFKKLRHPCDFCADFESLTTTKKNIYIDLRTIIKSINHAVSCYTQLMLLTMPNMIFFAKGS